MANACTTTMAAAVRPQQTRLLCYRWLLATSRAPVSDSCALGMRHASQICKDSEAVGCFSKAKQGFGKYLPSRYCPIYLDFPLGVTQLMSL